MTLLSHIQLSHTFSGTNYVRKSRAACIRGYESEYPNLRIEMNSSHIELSENEIHGKEISEDCSKDSEKVIDDSDLPRLKVPEKGKPISDLLA